MSDQHYRELLKKASRDKKLGPWRMGIPGLAGLFVGGYGLFYEMRLELVIMGLLLLYIAYLQYEQYITSCKLFKSLEYMAESYQGPPDELEEDLMK